MSCKACGGSRVSSKGKPCHACLVNDGIEPDDLKVEITPYATAAGDLATEASTAAKVLAAIEAIQCDTAEQAEQIAVYLRHCKTFQDTLEKRRKAITGPLNEAKRAVDSLFKPAVEPYKKAEQILKRKLLDYQRETARRNVEAMTAMAQAHQAGDHGAVMAIAADSTMAPPPELEGVSTAERWAFEVVDAGALPREFLEVNTTAIRLAMSTSTQENGAPPDIPGVRFYRERYVIARALK